MELRNAASISKDVLLPSMDMAYSITEASQGKVILPLSVLAKPNSYWDIRKSSLKTFVPSSTSNHRPSALYTTQWPLPATDEYNVPHDSLIGFFRRR